MRSLEESLALALREQRARRTAGAFRTPFELLKPGAARGSGFAPGKRARSGRA